MASACTPRIRKAEQAAAAAREKEAAEQAERAATAKRLADAERASLEDPDRPAVLHPQDWPEKITVRIVEGQVIIAETGSAPDCSGPGCTRIAAWQDAEGSSWCDGHRHSLVSRIDPAGQTSWDAKAETAEDLWDPGTVMAGAEVALAAVGYTLDRFRLYADMSLMVGHFYRKAGPYA